MPDDFIVIPQMHKVYVNGEVKNAGNFQYEKGLPFIKLLPWPAALPIRQQQDERKSCESSMAKNSRFE